MRAVGLSALTWARFFVVVLFHFCWRWYFPLRINSLSSTYLQLFRLNKIYLEINSIWLTAQIKDRIQTYSLSYLASIMSGVLITMVCTYHVCCKKKQQIWCLFFSLMIFQMRTAISCWKIYRLSKNNTKDIEDKFMPDFANRGDPA